MYRFYRCQHWFRRAARLAVSCSREFRTNSSLRWTSSLGLVVISHADHGCATESLSKQAEQLVRRGDWLQAVQIYNQILVEAVKTHGSNSWNVISPTRDLCWAMHRQYETDPSCSEDLKMASILLHQAYHLAADVEIDDDLRHTEMTAICEQLSAVWLELDHPDYAVEWIEKGIAHLSNCKCKEAHLPRLSIFLSTCLNQSHRYEEAESVARTALAMAKRDSENMCMAYYELGNALEYRDTRSDEAAAAFQHAIRIARKRGASMAPVRIESQAKLARLSAAAKQI